MDAFEIVIGRYLQRWEQDARTGNHGDDTDLLRLTEEEDRVLAHASASVCYWNAFHATILRYAANHLERRDTKTAFRMLALIAKSEAWAAWNSSLANHRLQTCEQWAVPAIDLLIQQIVDSEDDEQLKIHCCSLAALCIRFEGVENAIASHSRKRHLFRRLIQKLAVSDTCLLASSLLILARLLLEDEELGAKLFSAENLEQTFYLAMNTLKRVEVAVTSATSASHRKDANPFEEAFLFWLGTSLFECLFGLDRITANFIANKSLKTRLETVVRDLAAGSNTPSSCLLRLSMMTLPLALRNESCLSLMYFLVESWSRNCSQPSLRDSWLAFQIINKTHAVAVPESLRIVQFQTTSLTQLILAMWTERRFDSSYLPLITGLATLKDTHSIFSAFGSQVVNDAFQRQQDAGSCWPETGLHYLSLLSALQQAIHHQPLPHLKHKMTMRNVIQLLKESLPQSICPEAAVAAALQVLFPKAEALSKWTHLLSTICCSTRPFIMNMPSLQLQQQVQQHEQDIIPHSSIRQQASHGSGPDIAHLIQHMKRGLELKTSRSSELLAMYEARFREMAAQQKEVERMLQLKTDVLAQTETLLSRVQKQCEASDNEHEQMRRVIQELESSRETLAQDYRAARQHVEQLQAKLSQAEQEVSQMHSVQSQLADEQARREQLEVRLQDAEMKVSRLETTLHDRLQTLERLREEFLRVEGELSQKERENLDYEHTTRRLRTQLQDVQDQFKGLQSKHGDAVATVERQQVELYELQSLLDASAHKRKALEKQVNAANKRAAIADEKLMERDAEKRALEAKCAQLQKTLARFSQLAAGFQDLTKLAME